MGDVTPPQLTLEKLQEIEWKRFEEAVALYFRLLGFRTELTALGPDDATDVRLFKPESQALFGIVQCKARTRDEPVDTVRVVAAEKARQKAEMATIVTTGGFTFPARQWAKEQGIGLLSGNEFIARVLSLPAEKRSEWLTFAFSGDYHTPSCPSCGSKMVEKPGGANHRAFWGCRNFPRCHGKLPMRKADAPHPPPVSPPPVRSSATPPPSNPSTPPPRFDFPQTAATPREIQVERRRLKSAVIFGLVCVGLFSLYRVSRPRVQAAGDAQPSRPVPSHLTPPQQSVASPASARLPASPQHQQPSPAALQSSTPPPPSARPAEARLEYKKPTRLFHVAIEVRESASSEQRAHAQSIAQKILEKFDPNRLPPYFGIETLRSARHPKLKAVMLFDTHNRELLENRIYVMSAELPAFTAMLVDNHECYFVGHRAW